METEDVTIIFLSGFVGLATIIAAISFPFSVYLLADTNLTFYGFSAMLLILIAHHKNILRLIRGKENRFDKIHIFNKNSIFRKN